MRVFIGAGNTQVELLGIQDFIMHTDRPQVPNRFHELAKHFKPEPINVSLSFIYHDPFSRSLGPTLPYHLTHIPMSMC